MRYPVQARWVEVGQCEDGMRIHDKLEESVWIVDEKLGEFLYYLDGNTDPYDIDGYSKRYVDDALAFFREEEFIRENNYLIKKKGTVYRTLWVTSDKRNNLTICICKGINTIMLALWIPLLVTSLLLSQENYEGGILLYFIGSIIGLVMGTIIHEVGHAVATIAVGGDVYEFGVMIDVFIPGSYVLADDRNVGATIGQRIQVDAAGIESNFSLMALSLIIGPYTIAPMLFFGIALINMVLGTINLMLPKQGLDSEHILSKFLEVDDVTERASLILSNSVLRRRIQSEGIIGKMAIVFLRWVHINQNNVFFFIKLIVLEMLVSHLFCEAILV